MNYLFQKIILFNIFQRLMNISFKSLKNVAITFKKYSLKSKCFSNKKENYPIIFYVFENVFKHIFHVI